MTNHTRIWRVIVSALLIVLVLALTVGIVCHDHGQCSAASCTLCHLNIAPPAPAIGTSGLVLAAAEYSVAENSFISRCVANERPPRAPPV